jgi:hypothetical protein
MYESALVADSAVTADKDIGGNSVTEDLDTENVRDQLFSLL